MGSRQNGIYDKSFGCGAWLPFASHSPTSVGKSARRYNIELVLSLHCPPGTKLLTTDNDSER